MRPIAPRIGFPEVMIAEEQEEYLPLAAAIVEHTDGSTSRVCRWTFTKEERQRIGAGEDIYFATPASVPLTPHSLQVGWERPEEHV